jgi:hypothetical protein
LPADEADYDVQRRAVRIRGALERKERAVLDSLTKYFESVLDLLTKYFGSWIWYAHPTAEYERLRFSLLSLNTFLILCLALVLGWAWYQDWFRDGLCLKAKRITAILSLGFASWLLMYAIQLCTFHQDDAKFHSTNLTDYAHSVLSAISTLCFFLAGSYLLELGEERFHKYLRPPTEAGLSLKWACTILGNRIAQTSFGVLVAISLWPQFSDPGGQPGRVFDSVLSFVAHVTFGLGLLRELNRERRDLMGLFAGWSMVFYGGVQLSSIWEKELDFWGYSLAAFLKLVLLLTIVGFISLIKHTRQARRETQLEERREFTLVLVSLGGALRHELSKPLTVLDRRVAQLELRIPEARTDLNDALEKARRSVDAFFDIWAERLEWKSVDLKETLAELGFKPEVGGEGPYLVVGPPFLFISAINRLRENAYKFGAQKVTSGLARDGHLICLRIMNDGPPVPPWATLFEKPHGTWVARQLLQMVGGNLRLESSKPTVFRVDLPAATDPAELEAQARERTELGATYD